MTSLTIKDLPHSSNSAGGFSVIEWGFSVCSTCFLYLSQGYVLTELGFSEASSFGFLLQYHISLISRPFLMLWPYSVYLWDFFIWVLWCCVLVLLWYTELGILSTKTYNCLSSICTHFSRLSCSNIVIYVWTWRL